MESPKTSQLPTFERKVDHLSSIVSAVAVTAFLPIPLLLMFGAKALVPMGAVVFVVALIRLINSPIELERRPLPAGDPVAAAARVAQQPEHESTAASSPPITGPAR